MKGDVAALLRWKVRPGKEAEFAALWDEMTRVMLEHGSHGAALFQGEDGLFCALTRWPSVEKRNAGWADPRFDQGLLALADTIAEFLPVIDMVEQINHWTSLRDED